MFVDESGATIRITPLTGRAPRGHRCIGQVPRNWGQPTTLLAAMTRNGNTASLVVEGAADQNVFETFVEQVLAPTLQPGQVVVWDNLSVHRSPRARRAIEACGCELRFLPPYSPDFNPIEQAFSKLKTYLRRAEQRTCAGLSAFLAGELTRAGIWEAFKARRCYGTSRPRIVLDVSVSGHPMGSEPVLSDPPTLTARVLGTDEIDTVEVRRVTETVYTYTARPEPERDESWRVRIAWRGARNRGRSRPLDWTGSATVWTGRITGARDYAIDNALDGVTGWDEERVGWRSHTCGDWDGVILDLDGDDATRLLIQTPTMSLDCSLWDLSDTGIREFGPYLEQQVMVERFCIMRGQLMSSSPGPTMRRWPAGTRTGSGLRRWSANWPGARRFMRGGISD